MANEKRQKDEEAHRTIQAEQAKKIDQLFAANVADKAAMAKRMQEEEKKPPPSTYLFSSRSLKLTPLAPFSSYPQPSKPSLTSAPRIRPTIRKP